MTGEFQKLRKWIEWMSPKSLEDYHTQSSKLTKEQGEKVTQILGVLTTEIKGMSESVVAELKSLQELIQATLSTAPESTSAGEPGGMGTIRGGPEEMSSRVAPNVSGQGIPASGFPPLPPPALDLGQSPFTMPNVPPSSSMPTAPQTPVMVGGNPWKPVGISSCARLHLCGLLSKSRGRESHDSGIEHRAPGKEERACAPEVSE